VDFHGDMAFFEALGRSIPTLGVFDSIFTPGQAIHYHWLTYAWTGQFDNFFQCRTVFSVNSGVAGGDLGCRGHVDRSLDPSFESGALGSLTCSDFVAAGWSPRCCLRLGIQL